MRKKSNMYDKRVKTVTHLPGWVLKQKGKRDSRKGKGVCDAYISLLKKNLVGLESNKVIDIENGLFDSRKEAAVIITSFTEQKKILQELPDSLRENTPEAIRANRANEKMKKNMQTEIKNAIERLVIISENITNADVILDECINKMRSMTVGKIHSYIAGIRCGEFGDYIGGEENMDDSAREIYRAKHKELDEKIRTVIESMREEDVA